MKRVSAAVAAAALIVAALAPEAAAQARDFTPQSKLEPSGTALISGSVVTDEATPRPLRRVVVTITEAASIIQARVVTSDESGRFFFRNLPAGRYSISARRAPYLTGSYGVRRIAGPGSVQSGTVIVLANGQQVTNIDVTLMRGAVITGTIRDVDGQPARGFRVSIQYYQRSGTTGERTLVTLSSSNATTDDRGMYRIFSLPPGTYVVTALPPALGSMGDAPVTTDADIARATDLLQRSGAPAAAPASAAAGTPAPRRPTVGYTAIYYPGTPDPTQALPVTVDVAEERSGIDFQVQHISTARIEGTVSGLPPKQRVSIRAMSSGSVTVQPGGPVSASSAVSDEQGRFVMSNLAPGTYTLEARTPAPDDSAALWARADVTLLGDDRVVNLTLQPAMGFSGRIVFEGTSAKPIDVTKARVGLSPVFINPAAVQPNVIPSAAGEFAVPGVVPGRYRLYANFPIPSIESGWWVKSATFTGHETLDAPGEIRPGETVTNAVITMTDRPTEVSGTITDGSNNPAPEYFIILFAADQAHWVTGTRRIQQTRPSTDGLFSFKNLPPGDYRIAAVTDVQQGEWFDPAFLSQLVDASVKITLGEHGKVRQDIRIR